MPVTILSLLFVRFMDSVCHLSHLSSLGSNRHRACVSLYLLIVVSTIRKAKPVQDRGGKSKVSLCTTPWRNHLTNQITYNSILITRPILALWHQAATPGTSATIPKAAAMILKDKNGSSADRNTTKLSHWISATRLFTNLSPPCYKLWVRFWSFKKVDSVSLSQLMVVSVEGLVL